MIIFNLLGHITHTSKDAAFRIIQNDSIKIDSILGKFAAENIIMGSFGKEELAPHLKDKATSPDWASLEKKLVKKIET